MSDPGLAYAQALGSLGPDERRGVGGGEVVVLRPTDLSAIRRQHSHLAARSRQHRQVSVLQKMGFEEGFSEAFLFKKID